MTPVSDQRQQTERQLQADGIQAQVDELLRRMTPAEKVGQVTQYFYFRLPAGAATEPAPVSYTHLTLPTIYSV